MSKTIKEIADELGVSKTAIRNKMTDDFREKWVETLTANGVQTLVITEEGVNALKSAFRGGKHTTNLGANFAENQFVPNEDFKAELKAKNEQIEKLQKLLDQSQQLLLSEQKKSQLLIENQAPKTDVPSEWQAKQEVLENQISHYRNSANNANQRVREYQDWAERAEKGFWFAAILAGIFLVLLLVLGWLYLMN
jgi:DNA repair exonuclease SbcCD ATPase subunit